MCFLFINLIEIFLRKKSLMVNVIICFGLPIYFREILLLTLSRVDWKLFLLLFGTLKKYHVLLTTSQKDKFSFKEILLRKTCYYWFCWSFLWVVHWADWICLPIFLSLVVWQQSCGIWSFDVYGGYWFCRLILSTKKLRFFLL